MPAGSGGPGFGLGPLAARFDLDELARERLERLLSRLTEDPLAPTAIRERERAIDEHLADSLVGLEVPALQAAATVADLGSGAGLPGLPLAIARPEASFTLVESASRKCAFLARVVEECGLENVEIRHARAEEVVGRFDVVTARALASLPVIMEYAAPLLGAGGTLIAWRGQRDPQDELEGEAAGEILGLQPVSVLRVEPWPAAQHRYLHLISKVRPTPERFPRRPGMALKRPLGR
jgi:16S rRNA (guanine527-N7)-methyltransferase